MTVRAWIIRNKYDTLSMYPAKESSNVSRSSDQKQTASGLREPSLGQKEEQFEGEVAIEFTGTHAKCGHVIGDTWRQIWDIAQELNDIRDERTNPVAEGRYISPVESVHRAFCMAALQQMIGLDSRRWLRTGRYTPVALTRHSPACERPRECVHACVRACSARFRGCPTTGDLADTALHENVSLCFPAISWFSRTRSTVWSTCANEIYDTSNCIVNLTKHFSQTRNLTRIFDDFWSLSSVFLDKLNLFVISFL